MQPSIKKSEEVTEKTDEVFSDGAYYSPDNEKFGQENGIILYFTGFPGKEGRFEYNYSSTGLEIIDTQTGLIQLAEEVKVRKDRKATVKRYKIHLEKNGKMLNHYFDQTAVDAFFKRREIAELPPEIKNIRNNVEASIFQLSFALRKDKTRYRGKFKTQLWATNRGIWINFRRIVTFLGDLCPDHKKYGEWLPNLVIFILCNLLCQAIQGKNIPKSGFRS